MKEGWEIKKLGEVSEYFNGLTYSPKDVSDKGTIVLRSSNIQNDELDFSDLVRVNVNIKERLFLKEGDILMCSRNGSQRLVGKTAPILNLQEPMTFGTFMMIIRSEFSSYLLWFFKTDEFKKQISGGENTMINQVTRYMLDEIEIPLPPLPEQQRIVSILDECFAAIAKAKSNAEQNLKNAKELFESYLQGVFDGSTSSPTKREGWEEKKLGEVSRINYGYTEKASFDEVGPKFLRITDIQENGVDWDTVPYCKCSDKDIPKYKLETGDIVFARTGATTGKSYLIDNPPNSVFASYLIRLRMNSINEFIPEFISYFFQTKTYWDKINAGISGSAQGGFNATKLGELEFHFPKSKEDQQTIVRQLDALRAQTQKLEAIYQQKLLNLEELKKSLLQKAFSGELTTEKQ